MSFFSRLLTQKCKHYFSWPRTDGEGRYHQTCSRCGIAYEYDWSRMRRTDRRIGQDVTYSPRSQAIAPAEMIVRLPLGR
jgi:hypothetical protein